MAFDIGYTVEQEDGTEAFCFLPFMETVTRCSIASIPCVPVLANVRSLDEALAYPNDGESRVYSYFGLPGIEKNIMEGVVIRPSWEDIWFGTTRLIIKNKNEVFKERKAEKKPVEVPLADNIQKAVDAIAAYVTEARVNNVISHIGEVTEKDIGRLIGLASRDALDEFRRNGALLDGLSKQEEKMVTKRLNTMMAATVRKVVFDRLHWNSV